MSKVKVIVQVSYGIFEPDAKLQKLIDKVGVPFWSIEGRTNEQYINHVETRAKDGLLTGKEGWSHIRVTEVDTSKPWLIDNYDGSESIKYVGYSFVNKDLNYVKFND
ncbi:hypothetical protein ABE178_16275 [Priestia megaterium]